MLRLESFINAAKWNREMKIRSFLLSLLATTSLVFSMHAVGVTPQGSVFEILDIDQFEVPNSAHNIQLNNLKGIGIEMQIPSGSKSPLINFYREFNASQSDALKITAKGLQNQTLTIYWAGTDCILISTDCKLIVNPSPTSGVWIAQMHEHPLWRDRIKQLRIDFSKSNGVPFILSSIQIISTESNNKAVEETKSKTSKDVLKPASKMSGKHTITSNMFNLDMREILKLKRKKFGGGLGATESELILVSGDGQVRIIILGSSEVIKPTIELPENNEEEALAIAKNLEPVSFSEKAIKNIKNFLRYDDILVFEDAQSRHLIISYSHFDPSSSCFSHRLSLLSVPRLTSMTKIEAASHQWDLLFSSQPCLGFKKHGHAFGGHQSGGRINVLDIENGDIVLALGDYTFDGMGRVPNYPQNLDVDYGKVIKINIHNKTKEILSIGNRNTQGIKVDSEGRIWEVEHGPQGGDELNQVKKGVNFGWPHVTLGIQYGNKPWPFNQHQGRHKNYEPPTFAWVPSIGISNVDQSINFHPFWDGDLLVFSLNGNSIFRLRLNNDKVIFSEKIELPIKERVRYGLNHAPSKSLYVWTDSGKIYQITPSKQAWTLAKESRAQYKAFKNGKIQALTESEKTLAQCMECHTGSISTPPDLKGILGKRIASSTYTRYSDALKHLDGVWSEKNLRAYLMNPQKFAEGTAMPDQQIRSVEAADKIIAALKFSGK